MLENISNDYILPLNSELLEKVRTLDSAVKKFSSDPTNDHLIKAQELWKKAIQIFASYKPSNFGAAETDKGSYQVLVGSYPANVNSIETRIEEGKLNTTDFSYSTRGFYALDYLLFEKEPSLLVDRYIASENRRSYLVAVSEDLVSKTVTMEKAWKDHKIAFSTNSSTAAGSSISQFYNYFVKTYEELKNAIGVAVGRKVSSLSKLKNQSTVVEGLYSGETREIYKCHFDAIQNVWHGVDWVSREKSEESLEGYLKLMMNGTEIASSINEKLLAIKNDLDSLPKDKPISKLIEEAGENGEVKPLETLFVTMSQATSLIKSRMSSAMGINIIFNDGDGD